MLVLELGRYGIDAGPDAGARMGNIPCREALQYDRRGGPLLCNRSAPALWPNAHSLQPRSLISCPVPTSSFCSLGSLRRRDRPSSGQIPVHECKAGITIESVFLAGSQRLNRPRSIPIRSTWRRQIAVIAIR